MTAPTPHYETTFPLAWLKALRLLSSKYDTRTCLMGVALSRGRLIATDGCMLGTIQDERFADLPEVIIPNAAIDAVVSLAKGAKQSDVTVQWELPASDCPSDAHPNRLLLAWGPCVPFTSPIMHYPDATCVLRPDLTENQGHSQFDWPRLVVFEKAAVLLGASKDVARLRIHLTQGRPGEAARVRIPAMPAFEGVLMPRQP